MPDNLGKFLPVADFVRVRQVTARKRGSRAGKVRPEMLPGGVVRVAAALTAAPAGRTLDI